MKKNKYEELKDKEYCHFCEFETKDLESFSQRGEFPSWETEKFYYCKFCARGYGSGAMFTKENGDINCFKLLQSMMVGFNLLEKKIGELERKLCDVERG